MRATMVFLDLAWFIFFSLLKVGGLTAAIIYFADFSADKTRHGLMDLRPFTQSMVGYNIADKVEADRNKISGIERHQAIYGKPGRIE